MILFSRGRETLELITKGGHASLRPFRALPLFAKNFTKDYFEILQDQTDMAVFYQKQCFNDSIRYDGIKGSVK